MHYLISILAISTILGIYAFILILIEATVGNYGECEVKINKEKTLTVKGGSTLLDALISNEIYIPSACGGKGTCGYCKCSVDSGAGPVLPTETGLLTPEDHADNKRLACQIKIKEDLGIRIPADMLNAKEYRTRVSKIEPLTYDIKLIEFELQDGEVVEFKPGNYMQFRIPGTDEFRAYSIANPPRENTKIQFMVRLVPDGLCSTYIHQNLELGDEVFLTGPYGEFFLQDTDKEVICVAGGVGVPPLRSIILHLFHESVNTKRKVTYYFGARAMKDLYFYEECLALAEKFPNFTFVPALSSPDPNDCWEGEQGFIHFALDKRLQDGSNYEAYLCGPEPMINAITSVLLAKGVPPNEIYYDKF